MFDRCHYCDCELNDENEFWMLTTPPNSTTAGIIAICSDRCRLLLEEMGYHRPTETEKERLLAEVKHAGHRLHDEDREP